MNLAPNQDGPLYNRIRDVFKNGFKLDWIVTSFIAISHVVFLISTPFAYYYAPESFWKLMLTWTFVQAFIASLSTTVYCHRLVAHRAARKVSWPVHIFFGYFGHVLGVQGSVQQWVSNHVLHHGVDRSGDHHQDPYSASWFSSPWRNFLWSHILAHCFRHPVTEATKRAYASRQEALLVWQDRLYVPLLVFWNFAFPLIVGYLVAGALGAFCLMVASIGGFILAQHNTWTVNSITHMWGNVRGVFSSARNNYVWLGPMGEGNHHADHHDYARDYRNGFGWTGWLLDPSRYVIIVLRALGLVKGLQYASKIQEVEIIARRKLRDAHQQVSETRWPKWEKYLVERKATWVQATRDWEHYKQQKRNKLAELRQMELPKMELRKKRDQLKAELKLAKLRMIESRRAFFVAIEELQLTQFA